MAPDGSSATWPELHAQAGAALLRRDARSTNLLMAQIIRLGLERDLVDTCLQYGLTADQGQALLALAPEMLCTRVASIGNRSLFVPRQDLMELLDAPDELRATLAAARPAVPTPGTPG